MGKTEENDKSKLELKSASKPGGPFEIHSLNNFREVGNYTWIAREITDEMGFPNCVKDTDDCHYCEGQLFVMRHGAKKTSQSTDSFGQVLTIINHETRATNIFTRAVHPLDSDEWTPWQMVATGDPKLITENNDINKVLSTLRQQIENDSKRIETAENSLLASATVRFDRIEENETTINAGEIGATPSAIVYYKPANKFVAADNEGNYWDTWKGMDNYMSGGKIREDKVYLCGSGVYVCHNNYIVEVTKVRGNNINDITTSILPFNKGDSFNICDAKGYIIATIDKNGIKTNTYSSRQFKILDNWKTDLSICDAKGNIIATIDKNGIMTNTYSSRQFKTFDNGKADFAICDAKGNIIFKVDERQGVYEHIKSTVEKKCNKPSVSWIDDDFAILDPNSGEMRSIYQSIHDWCIEKNIRYDFGYIPDSSEKRLTIAKLWEAEGFNFLMHPTHSGWYEYTDNTHDIEKVKKSLIECIRFFKDNFVSNHNILVYPGSSNKFEDNVHYIKQYVECGITATDIGTNHGTENDKYQLKRLSLLLNAVKTKTKVKELIKQYIDNGDWVILYSHLYNHADSDIVDETTNSKANLLEIVEYANSLCAIRSSESIWGERKFMFNFK